MPIAWHFLPPFAARYAGWLPAGWIFLFFVTGSCAINGIKYRFMADYYIAISHKIKEVMVNDGIAADRISVVHSGIDLQRFCRNFR